MHRRLGLWISSLNKIENPQRYKATLLQGGITPVSGIKQARQGYSWLELIFNISAATIQSTQMTKRLMK